MTLPDGALGNGPTRVLLSVLSHRQPTYGTIMADTGLSRGYVYDSLIILRDAGLVTWTECQRGTIRATVRAVRI